MGIKVEAAAYSSIGGRRNNEDNFYLNGSFMSREQMNSGAEVREQCSQPLQIYAVFDGMGGGDMGEYASFYASEQLKKYQDTSDHADHAANLRSFLTKTSKGIDRISLDNGLRSGSCGSTAAMLIVGDWWYRTAHVGDSRIYLIREDRLTRLTKDQSEVQRMVDAGRLTQDEAWSHPRKNIITHHLGMPLRGGELQSIISDRRPLQVGDCFLVCSDGVSDSLRDSEIQELFRPRIDAEENAKYIVHQAKRHADEMGVESDNITAVVVKILQVAGSDEAARRVRKLKLLQKLAVACAALCSVGAVGALIQLVRTLLG